MEEELGGFWVKNLRSSRLKILVGWRFCEVVGWRRRKRDYVWGRVIGSGRRRAPCNEIQTVAIYSTHFSRRPQQSSRGSWSIRIYQDTTNKTISMVTI